MEIESNSLRKRKSGGENEFGGENTSPNLSPLPGVEAGSAKKLRFRNGSANELPVASTTSQANIAKPTKCGLARYVPKHANVAKAQSSTAPTVVATAPATNDKKKPLGETTSSQNHAVQLSVPVPIVPPVAALMSTTTPSKSKGFAKTGVTPSRSARATRDESPSKMPADNAILRRLALMVHGNSGKIISGDLETAFSVTDEKILTIMQALRAKKGGSWDFKEKVKKQEGVIKELKDAIQTTLGEIKPLREICAAKEADLETLLKDAHSELQTSLASCSMYKSNEVRANKELAVVSEELTKVNKALRKLSEEHAPIKKNEALLTTQCADQQQKIRILEEAKTQLELTKTSLETELRIAKESSAQSIELMRSQYEQRIEQSSSTYRDEVLNLRAELSKRLVDAERVANDRSDQDRKYTDLREELLKSESAVREARSALARSENELSRLTNDLDLLRNQLNQKDSDLRSTLNSLQEIQRQSLEEKYSIRAELSACQMRNCNLEEERLSLTTELATKREECTSANKEVAHLREVVTQTEQRLVSREAEVLSGKEACMQLEVEKELRARFEIREESERTERIAACAQLLATQIECSSRIRENEQQAKLEQEKLKENIVAIKTEKDALVEEGKRLADRIMGLEFEDKQIRQALAQASASQDTEAVEKLGKVTGELEILRRRMNELLSVKDYEGTVSSARIRELEEQLKAEEIQRRKLHNVIQELRGNVRVFARVRPFLPSDGIALDQLPEPSIQTRSDGASLRISKAAKGDERAEDHSFAFDRTFGPSISQDTIFQEVAEFVQSALDGYNVCLFSYGQTGSGKTHTMQGSGTGSMRGIIPRAMQQVGKYKTELESKGWEYKMEVSFVEIYNETIRDLIRSGSAPADLKHEIKREANGNNMITDITMLNVDPNNNSQMEEIMELAARQRSTAQTAMNERSSRSHSVFTLHLRASNASQGVVLKGTLSLVDLAGSERLDRSGATGARMKETVAINKSLSALTDVFVAIGNKQAHIPFRNSKLTYLLQPALSGDGKTLMMVNLSPTEESYFESLCSLRFAKQVNQCELGKPKKQVKDGCAPSAALTNVAAVDDDFGCEEDTGAMESTEPIGPITPGKSLANRPVTAPTPIVTTSHAATTITSTTTAAAPATTASSSTATTAMRRKAPVSTATASSSATAVKKSRLDISTKHAK